MKKIVFITTRDAELGFSLTGITQRVADVANAEAELIKTTAGPDIGLIVIDERLLRGMSEERMRELEEGWHGIVLALPSPEKVPAEAEDYAARLIRRAIGYHVRINV